MGQCIIRECADDRCNTEIDKENLEKKLKDVIIFIFILILNKKMYY